MRTETKLHFEPPTISNSDRRIDKKVENKTKPIKLRNWGEKETEMCELVFGVYMVRAADSEQELQYNVNTFEKELTKVKMNIDVYETRKNRTHNMAIEEKRREDINNK